MREGLPVIVEYAQVLVASGNFTIIYINLGNIASREQSLDLSGVEFNVNAIWDFVVSVNDGDEYQYINAIGITDPAEISGILHSIDYDNDGLPDGFEIRTAYWLYINDPTNFSAGKYLNLTNASDAYEDFDSDGLINLEEYQRDPSGDYDHDGTPDIYDNEDDNDGLPTSVELQYHLDPFNSADANGDLDHDGLTNLFEYENGLNIQDKDTDHDGINDGDELNYWENRLGKIHSDWTAGQILNMSVNYTKNPDVDHDNITDGKEIKGYEVKIITGWDSDGNPISEMKTITPDEMDPLIPYANSTGVYPDTDGDGIPDVVESWFSNVSIVKSASYRQAFKEKFGSDLYNQYSWVINYFWTIVNKQNESAAKEWLHDQFNPMVVEKTPPQVVVFEVKFYYYILTAYVWYHVVVRDAGEMKKVKFYNLDNGNVKSFTPDSNYLEFSGSFLATPWGANLGFKLKVYAEDIAENKITVKKEIKGPVGQLLDALAKLWNKIWNALVQVAKAIMSALNFILEWIVNLFMDAFQTMMESAKSVVSELISTVILDIDGIYKGKVTMADFVRDIITSKVFLIMLGFMVGLTVINYLIMATGIGGAILTVISAALLVALGITMVSIGISFVLNPTNDILKGWIESILNYVTGGGSSSQRAVGGYNLYADDSTDKLFEEISLFVLPLFWTISALAAEDEALIAFAVGFDFVALSLDMVYMQMEQWHFDKNATINVTKGIIGALVGGIIVAGIGMIIAILKIKTLIAIFDAIVLAWSVGELINSYKEYQNLTSGGRYHA